MNDIAILQLTLPFYVEDDTYVSRACLSSKYDPWFDPNKYPSNGTRLALSGWDITNIGGSSRSKILQQAEVYVIDDDNSYCALSTDQRPLQFCAGHYGDDKGSFLMLNI
jgi:hypothetical protein